MMGYECRYIYHERTEDGFDKENSKEMVKRVGSAYEDVPVEKLAGAIMGQLVRRDIWVVDVEVYEYTKKKINFKESKGGVVIKGKKYSFDGVAIVVEDEVEPQAPAQPQIQHQAPAQQQVSAPLPVRQAVQAYPVASEVPVSANINLADVNYFKTRKPLRHEVYHPDDIVGPIARKMRLPFTLGKKYPIYEERMVNREISYITINDHGQKAVLHHRHFIVPQNLIGGFESDEQSHEVELDFGGEELDMPMPKLR